MPFTFQRLAVADVIVVTPGLFPDRRGWFLETYRAVDFAAGGIPDVFVQDNHARSLRGTLRGLHYQLPAAAQAKLVRCVAGEVFDVAVDVRRSSPTFGRWVAEVLSAENRRMLYIPVGFAHGYCVLGEAAEIVYKASGEYSREQDRGILWSDPDIGIPWPVEAPVLSARDEELPRLREAEVFP